MKRIASILAPIILAVLFSGSASAAKLCIQNKGAFLISINFTKTIIETKSGFNRLMINKSALSSPFSFCLSKGGKTNIRLASGNDNSKLSPKIDVTFGRDPSCPEFTWGDLNGSKDVKYEIHGTTLFNSCKKL